MTSFPDRSTPLTIPLIREVLDTVLPAVSKAFTSIVYCPGGAVLPSAVLPSHVTFHSPAFWGPCSSDRTTLPWRSLIITVTRAASAARLYHAFASPSAPSDI